MSTPQTTHKRPEGWSLTAADTEQADPAEWLSAAADGECPEAGWSCLAQVAGRRTPGSEPETLAETWMEFHLIGDALRAGPQTMPAPSSSFVSAVMARVATEQPQWSSQASPAGMKPMLAELAPAATRPAANDAVFRWKMVAGVASLAAVVAVAWQLTVAPAAGLPGGSAGPQLASAPAGAPAAAPTLVATPAAAVGPRDTVVSTDAGVLLRDPELEAFIAAHRQSGGMSALQMPAGFLRNATFEAPQR